jgi:hypothetical protein
MAADSSATLLQSADESKPGSQNRWLYAIGAVVAVIIIGVIAAAVTGSKNASAPTPTGPTGPVVHQCSSYPSTKKKPQSCLTSNGPCSEFSFADKPAVCLSSAQLALQPKAKRQAAAKAKAASKAAAAAAKRAAARAKARAARHAAFIARANAWHKGYFQQDGNVYWKWSDSGSCAEYAESGCWHVIVITRHGCPSYVAVNANEYEGKAIVGQLLANQGYGIPPKTPRRFELDADKGNVTASDVSIDCE